MTETSRGVDNIIASPTEDTTVTVIVTISNTEPDTTKTAITNTDGTIEEVLPFDCLAVTIPETELETMHNIDGVEAIEIEGVFTGKQASETGYTGYAGYPPGEAVKVNSTAEEVFNIDS